MNTLSSKNFIFPQVEKEVDNNKHCSIFNIILDVWPEQAPLCVEKKIFCYKVLIQTINATLNGNYNAFDGVSTTNCCHGIAILTKILIEKLCNKQHYLLSLIVILKNEIKNLETKFKVKTPEDYFFLVPQDIITLCHLHIIAFASQPSEQRGLSVKIENLLNIASLTKNFYGKLVRRIQKKISTIIAKQYFNLVSAKDRITVNGISSDIWKKYTQESYLRKDCDGFLYASNLFSMQICLAFLIKSNSKIAIINNMIDSNNKLLSRYLQIFKGNGQDKFTFVELDSFKSIQTNLPIVFFSGVSMLGESNSQDTIKLGMEAWRHDISKLILMCDIFYPQFPQVMKDPNFNNSPIEPKDTQINNLILSAKDTKGVTIHDPSLFFLNHISLGGEQQITQWVKGVDKLPYIPIPNIAKEKSSIS